MPTMEDIMTAIHVEMRRRQLPEMDDDTVRELAKQMQHPDAMQAFESGQWTAGKIVDEVQAALQGMAEGGDIADRSGQQTALVRRQLGIEPPNSLLRSP